jgi:hypothetical protein
MGRAAAAIVMAAAALSPALALGSPAAAVPALSSAAARTAAPAVAAAARWSVQAPRTPDVPDAAFEAVSCPTASWCMAVGISTDTQGFDHPLAERWDGSQWTLTTTVQAKTGLGAELFGVSCVSPTACVAVGNSVQIGAPDPIRLRYGLFAERWNGKSWTSIMPKIGIRSATLTSVSCFSARACVAIGMLGNTQGDPLPFGGVMASWNGRRWTRIAAPAPPGRQIELTSISCTKAGACTAGGSYWLRRATAVTAPLVETRARTGGRWSYRGLPVPFPASAAALRKGRDQELATTSVSCVSRTACTLIGYYRHENVGSSRWPQFSEVWNGATWRLVKMPDPEQLTTPQSISCWAPQQCLALGNLTQGATTTTFAERQTASGWTLVAAPTFTAQGGDRSLACKSAAMCTAIGTTAGSGQNRLAVSQLTNAGWSAQTPGAPAGTASADFTDVSCSPGVSSQCAAVGSYENGTGGQSVLAERGSPGSWSVTPAPTPSGVYAATLASVSCPSTTFCMAVGNTAQTLFSTSREPLAEIWNGSSWQLVPLPDPGTNFGNELVSVSCASPNFCVAVGSAAQKSGLNYTTDQLVETWSAGSWQIASGTLVALPPHDNPQAAVSCVTTTFCLAVGGSLNGKPDTLALSGTTWTTASQPGLISGLDAVSCISATWCLAVGASASSPSQPVAASWTGGSWKKLSPKRPSPYGGGGNPLTGVSCTAARSCVAVGYAAMSEAGVENTEYVDRPFADSLRGNVWTVLNLPVPARSLGTALPGISCAAANACVAAGQSARIAQPIAAMDALRA